MQFVISLNLVRRHLNESQRGMVAAKLANMAVGNPDFSYSANLPNRVSQSEAADMLNVSERTVRAAVVGIDRVTVTEKIADFTTDGQMSDSGIFGNFTPELYSIWNFAKATNEVKHFGC